MRRNDVWVAAVVALVLSGCDEGATELRDVVLETASGSGSGGDESGGDSGDESGGDDTGTTGDEAQSEFEVGEPLVCLEDVQFAALPTGQDLTSAPVDPLQAQVACPMAGVGVAKYVDYRCQYNTWDGSADLYCKYWCDCSVKYTSPCNPPHADCGGDYQESWASETNVSTYPWGMGACLSAGWAACRGAIGKEAGYCASKCQYKAPKRTLDCPGCGG